MKRVLLLAAGLLISCADDDDGGAAPGPTPDATDVGGADAPASGDSTGGDDTIVPPVEHPFLFGIDTAQQITQAPFPNDLYLSGGTVSLPDLGADPLLATLGKAELLTEMTAYANERNGFGSTSAIWLWMSEAPMTADLDEHIQMVTLSGPEAGREVAVQVTWNEKAGAIGVFPAWGDYLVPGSTYAVLVRAGIQNADGADIEPNPTFQAVIAPEDDASLAAARAAFAPLRAWIETSNVAREDYTVGTVFTTETVYDYGLSLFDGSEEVPLEPISRRYRYDADSQSYVEATDVEGVALETYFGSPLPPFEHNPGIWGGNRERAQSLPDYDQVYTGGTGHFGVARVINGSMVMPAFNFRVEDGEPVNQRLQFEDGLAVPGARAMVPFTLFLCGTHLTSPDGVPVALFGHGGGALRSDAVAFASANCQADVATIAIDMVFHGGRRAIAYEPGEDLIVPVEVDQHNVFTGLSEDEPNFVPDFIGDPAGAAASVAKLYAVPDDADPMVVEANLLTIAVDTHVLVRYLREGDWSPILENLRFDDGRIYHNSLSFGTSFATPLLAISESFEAVIGSVGSGYMLSVNLPMAPANALYASGLLIKTLDLPTNVPDMQRGSHWQVMLGLHQWLHERGDPMAWAPHVLRYREGRRPSVLHSGNSWDETLFNPAQISYANALGLTTYTAGAEWTIDPTVPGAERLDPQPLPEGGVSGNATFGEETVTAAILWRNQACHAQVITSLCTESFVHPYPPIEALDEPVVKPSPICGLHAQAIEFIGTVGEGARVIAPTATCEAVYGD